MISCRLSRNFYFFRNVYYDVSNQMDSWNDFISTSFYFGASVCDFSASEILDDGF